MGKISLISLLLQGVCPGDTSDGNESREIKSIFTVIVQTKFMGVVFEVDNLPGSNDIAFCHWGHDIVNEMVERCGSGLGICLLHGFNLRVKV